MSGTAAVVLAAGGASRFDGPGHKLTARVGPGTTLAARAVQTAVRATIGPVLVVVGAVDAADLGLADAAIVVGNDAWADGQATSLATAVDWARAEGMDAIVVGLGDQPGLAVDAWRAVAAARATPIAVATYLGTRGHPIRLGASVWDRLPRQGDEGARALLVAEAPRVTEVPCVGDPVDIDTTEDLAAWTARPARPTNSRHHR